MAGRAGDSLRALAMGGLRGGESVQPMVVRVVVPSRKRENSDIVNDANVLLDPDASAEEVLKSLRRLAALAKSPKFVQGGSKAATPVIKAVLSIIRSRSSPSDESVLLAVLETLTVFCKAVKGAAIIMRLEGGLPYVISLITHHIKRTSFQRAGFVCLAALASSPQNAIAIIKAGAVQAVLAVLNDKETKYLGADSMDAAMLALNLLSTCIKSTEGCLPLLGTLAAMQAVVNAIYARVGNKRVVTAATELLFLVVKRYTSEDVTEAMMLRYSDKVRDAGGVDAMLVVVGRYSDCPDLFKLAYAVLNRLQRSVLTADLLGEFAEARVHLSKVAAEDPANTQLLFPESQDFSTDMLCCLDAEHAAAVSLPRRAVPQAISGARRMVKGGGVQAAWSRSCSPTACSFKREPFLPPGPEVMAEARGAVAKRSAVDQVTNVMAEVMLLNVARWLKTRPQRNRVVYNVHSPVGPCDTLFDGARYLVYADAQGAAYCLNRHTAPPPADRPLSPTPSFLPHPPAPHTPQHMGGGEDDVADEGVVEDEGEGDALEWSVGAVPQVQRKRVSAGTPVCRVQHDSDEEDMSEHEREEEGDEEPYGRCADADSEDEDLSELEHEGDDVDALDGGEGEGDGDDGLDGAVDAAELLRLLDAPDTSDSLLLPGGEAGSPATSPCGFDSAHLHPASPDLHRASVGGNVGLYEHLAASLPPCPHEHNAGEGEGEGAAGEPTLLFDSRFEGGNLARVVQVDELEYDLYLMPDINTKAAQNGGNTQWYYFAVSNMEAGVEYKMNILNLIKPDSLYNVGMRPALFSVTDASSKGLGWRRVGERIAYYENHFETESGQAYYTLTFTLTFPHANDVCYLAHCFPYTYSDLSAALAEVLQRPNAARMLKMSTLCTTLVGNKCPLLTVTNFTSSPDAIAKRRAICISARVHPGETCASWTMQGLIEFICGNSPRARILRDNFVFKVVPMLNPDGVINGQYRCSLSGHDLNRQWSNPCRALHPTIHSIKTLLRSTKTMREVSLYCDIHGHSRKCNMFMYGCASKHPALRLKERVFPFLLHNESLMFSYDDCNFKVQRCKESAARVVAWRELAIANSYTLEMSLGGGDFGQDPAVTPPQHFTLEDYIEMGRLLCEAILDMYDPGRVRLEAALAELEVVHPEIKRAPGEDILSIDADSVRGGRDVGGRERGDIGEDELPKKKKEVSAPKPALPKKNVSKSSKSGGKSGPKGQGVRRVSSFTEKSIASSASGGGSASTAAQAPPLARSERTSVRSKK